MNRPLRTLLPVLALLVVHLLASPLRAAPREHTPAESSAGSQSGDSQSGDSAEGPADGVAAGHSYHGEAFNEGPRQAARRLEGIAPIEFPTSAKEERTQAFIEQDIAQLHGFWYLEAERSFRQAAAEEPELAIAYWGMAMANTNNRKRATGLIAQAMELRAQGTSDREKRYIEALERYLGPAPDEKQDDQRAEAKGEDKTKTEDEKKQESDRKEAKRKRAERYLADLEQILHENPDDIEAKALLAVRLWMSEREGVSIPSRYAVDALLGDVFRAQPMHPAHHYRIHLWDQQRPENALASAARCGPAMPAIAHMWHMPGHIYSRLHRYADAAWQQEASARVDHAHISRARLMPDQIHNFAHNNEWLIRNLIHLGRSEEALLQARNLVSLPRHPKYNSLEKGGSSKYGHQRLLQVLSTYELWPQLVEEAEGPYLAETGDSAADDRRTGWLAVAHLMTDNRREGAALHRRLQRQRLRLQERLLDLADAAAEADVVDASEPINSEPSESEETAEREGETIEEAAEDRSAGGEAADGEAADGELKPEKIKAEIERLNSIISRVAAAAAAVRKDAEAVRRHAETAKLESTLHARWLAMAGDLEGALKIATKSVDDGKGEVPPLAVLVDLLWRQGNQEEAKKRFAVLQPLASKADLKTPLLARLSPVAAAAGAADQLGPFQWEPAMAPSWQARSAEDQVVGGEQYDGRPRILIFYLGFGCLHCVEQLQAFAPQAEAFEHAGIKLVGISSETVEQLQLGMTNFDSELPIPLLADPEHQVFKDYACWDDFEQQPLHGTFLVDAQGRIRWQDIGHEPFTDAAFLLKEAGRLLALPKQ